MYTCIITFDSTLSPPPPIAPQLKVASLMDKRVEIHGTSRADMNGKRGVATDFHYDEDRSKWRYTVQLDSGEAFKLKLTNVRAEGTGGASGVGKGKKGKGKKGKKGRGGRA